LYRQDRPFLLWIVAEINGFTLAFREVVSQVQFGDSALDLVDGMILEALGDEWRVVGVTAIRPDLPSVSLSDVPDLCYIREVSKFSLPNSI
jgi:hypothetical protein